MAFDHYIRPEAELDIQEAYDWYDGKLEGLGDQFFSAVMVMIRRIRDRPAAFAVIKGGVRLARLERFQYVIAYLFEHEEVEIIAVYHAHRDPNVWQSRLD